MWATRDVSHGRQIDIENIISNVDVMVTTCYTLLSQAGQTYHIMNYLCREGRHSHHHHVENLSQSGAINTDLSAILRVFFAMHRKDINVRGALPSYNPDMEMD